jgi:hypothetical protein
MSSLAETSFDYEGVVWTCALLPYRIIVCRDAIQYIVQRREETMYRNLSYFTDWSAIERQYPELAMAGLPLESAGILDCKIKRRISRSKEKPADREAVSLQVGLLRNMC